MAYTRITLSKHYSVEKLEKLFLACVDPVEKEHWHIIWLLSREDKEHACSQVADMTGCSADWVRKLVRRYNKNPAKGLSDHRKNNGNAPIPSDDLLKKLQEQPEGKAPDKGLWSGPKVAPWISEEPERPVSHVMGLELP